MGRSGPRTSCFCVLPGYHLLQILVYLVCRTSKHIHPHTTAIMLTHITVMAPAVVDLINDAKMVIKRIRRLSFEVDVDAVADAVAYAVVNICGYEHALPSACTRLMIGMHDAVYSRPTLLSRINRPILFLLNAAAKLRE